MLIPEQHRNPRKPVESDDGGHNGFVCATINCRRCGFVVDAVWWDDLHGQYCYAWFRFRDSSVVDGEQYQNHISELVKNRDHLFANQYDNRRNGSHSKDVVSAACDDTIKSLQRDRFRHAENVRWRRWREADGKTAWPSDGN